MDEYAREQLAELAEDVICVMKTDDISGWLYVQDENASGPPFAMLVAETPDELVDMVVTLFGEMESPRMRNR
jgi:hypothetical protein